MKGYEPKTKPKGHDRAKCCVRCGRHTHRYDQLWCVRGYVAIKTKYWKQRREETMKEAV